MQLKINTSATFKTGSGEVVYGCIVSVMPNHYLVVVDGRPNGQYGDSLWRFTDRDVVKG